MQGFGLIQEEGKNITLENKKATAINCVAHDLFQL